MNKNGQTRQGGQGDEAPSTLVEQVEQVEPVPGKPSVKHFVQPGDAGGGTRQNMGGGIHREIAAASETVSHPPRTVTRAGRHSLTPSAGPSSRWARAQPRRGRGRSLEPVVARQRHAGFGVTPVPEDVAAAMAACYRSCAIRRLVVGVKHVEGLPHAALLLRSRGR